MPENSTGILWLDIIILLVLPIIIGPIFIFFKSLWDRYNMYKKDLITLKYTETSKKYRLQLQNFYWPIYVYLLEEYVLWSTIKSNLDERVIEDSYSETDSDFGIDRELYKTCEYVDEVTNKKCRNIVPIQCSQRSNVRCIYHLNKKTVVKSVFKEFVIENDEVNVVDLEKGCETLEDIYKDCLDSDDDKESEKTITKPILSAMQDKMLKNHHRIVSIIENNIYLAEPDKYMRKILMKYIQFANMLSIVIDTDEDVEKLKDLGVRYPRKLLPIIERKVNLIQEKYNEITNVYFSKINKF